LHPVCFSAQARCPSRRRRDTTDPGCIRSGGREPGPGRRLLPLRSSRSPHGTASPLRETERDAVIVGDSIVRHVRATLAEGKVHTHCFPGARVLDVSAQIPAILKADESPRAVVLHAGVNDTTQRQTETLKRDFRSLIETVRSTTPAATIIVSGPQFSSLIDGCLNYKSKVKSKTGWRPGPHLNNRSPARGA
uniref:SGNH hydrolase-type esterase domain-containing protein n=1 Tax=Cyprinus carpio carpio TaxID=630221 RepID=A0A9J8BPX8_CYPCA